MKPITLALTLEELRLLTALAEDQLFRREFIDPKMPGHKAAPGELALGKALVGRLRTAIEQNVHEAAPAADNYSFERPVRRNNRAPDAV